MEGDVGKDVAAVLGYAFQSTPAGWRETHVRNRRQCLYPYFNPLPPYGRRQIIRELADGADSISIHSLRMEGDPNATQDALIDSLFQSTPSVWRETSRNISIEQLAENFNPLPPYGGRR